MSTLWDSNFSYTAKHVRPSPVREMLSVIKQPGMISFAGGMPAPEVFPVDKFYEGAHVLKDHGKNLLQYGTTEGYPPLKEFLASFTAERMGRTVALDEMLLTTGSQQALELFASSMIDKGDVVITENPSYLAALTTFYNHGAQFVGIPTDESGMNVDLIPEAIEKARSEGKHVKFIYTIVNFHNPGGATMSLARRKKLVEISHKLNVPIFEDDPYGYVRYEGEHLPSIFSFDDQGGTVYAGSFSKILAPGARIGWVTGDRKIIRKLVIFKQAADLCSSPICQSLVYEYCKKGYLSEHLPNIIANYRPKRDTMEACLKKYLAPHGITWVKPEGGFFFWLDMPGIDCHDLFKRAVDKKVAFVVGTPFCVEEGAGVNKARLNFTFVQPDVIDEGVRRLGEAIEEMKG
ncbi:MAG: aminotransferase [Dethiosulfovibrio peptidovorans]|nr:MAG: aminotransferase [Dethiosulfovibrio peptidovorans]